MMYESAEHSPGAGIGPAPTQPNTGGIMKVSIKHEARAVRVRVVAEVYVDGQLVEGYEAADAYATYHGPDDVDFEAEIDHELQGLNIEVTDFVARALED